MLHNRIEAAQQPMTRFARVRPGRPNRGDLALPRLSGPSLGSGDPPGLALQSVESAALTARRNQGMWAERRA